MFNKLQKVAMTSFMKILIKYLFIVGFPLFHSTFFKPFRIATESTLIFSSLFLLNFDKLTVSPFEYTFSQRSCVSKTFYFFLVMKI